MPDESLESPETDELVDDDDANDDVAPDVTSAGVPVDISAPVLVEAPLCDGEDPQALLTSGMIAIAPRTSA